MVWPRSKHQRWHIFLVSKSTWALAAEDLRDSAPEKKNCVSFTLYIGDVNLPAGPCRNWNAWWCHYSSLANMHLQVARQPQWRSLLVQPWPSQWRGYSVTTPVWLGDEPQHLLAPEVSIWLYVNKVPFLYLWLFSFRSLLISLWLYCYSDRSSTNLSLVSWPWCGVLASSTGCKKLSFETSIRR